MKRLVLFVLLLAISIATKSQNLVVNPGFETWNKINKPAGWSHAENCLKDSTTFISGAYSNKHEGGSTTSDLGQLIIITPGKEYILSLNYKTIISSTGNGSRIWCYWKDEAGNSLFDDGTDAILRPSIYMKSETWEHFTVKFTAPAEATAFYLEVRTYPNSVTYWDDFVFMESILTNIYDDSYPELKIYPNPANNHLIISGINDLQHIIIHSFTGALIWSEYYSGENSVTIPISNFPNGIYFVTISSQTRLIIRRFIKN